MDLGAYLIFIVANAVMYVSLAWFLLKSFKLHRFRVVGFIIVTAPFVYVLLNAGSLFDLLWIMVFTPFYGLIVMILVYPTAMLVYYVVSLGSLSAVYILRKKVIESKKHRRQLRQVN